MKYERVYFFGDSITLGCDDTEGLGWPGRLIRKIRQPDQKLAAYNLGINGDTSEHIRLRWKQELMARSRDISGLIVFAFGFNDAAQVNGAGPQVELDVSVENARQILTEAVKTNDVLWIGPTPLDESVNPMVTPWASWQMFNESIERYDTAYQKLAVSLGVPYLPLFQRFIASADYQLALSTADKVHPADAGYELIAEMVSGWEEWVAITSY